MINVNAGSNDFHYDHVNRREMVTLDESPNPYLQYPMYGEIYVDEFDIHGNPLLFSFRPYLTNGTLGAKVTLGHTRNVEYRTGFRDGAKIHIVKWK